MKTLKTPLELLAPAGNFEKLEIAIHYGADALYLSGTDFSLRNQGKNFTVAQLHEAVALCRENRVKTYVACNIYPRTHEESDLIHYLDQIGDIRPDGIILADPGLVMTARQRIPWIPIHLSTQANTTSAMAARFWESMGVKRINAARELSLAEIKAISVNATLEIEAFAHGAMCISYSGRCLLSSFMARRDGNRGMCAHPCRWKYALVEELRPGEYMPLIEDDRGSYILNSKDLCMIGHIPKMVEAGISALKIEGRMKGILYLASAIKAYREAIDAYFQSPEAYTVAKDWVRELAGIGPRGYSTGFYLNDPDQAIPEYENAALRTPFLFAGKVLSTDGAGRSKIQVRNKLVRGDAVEIMVQKGPALRTRIRRIITADDPDAQKAKAGENVFIEWEPPVPCVKHDIIRKPDSF